MLGKQIRHIEGFPVTLSCEVEVHLEPAEARVGPQPVAMLFPGFSLYKFSNYPAPR